MTWTSGGRPVLVSGGTGFVGRAVAVALAERGHRPRLLVRDRSRISRELEAFEVVEGDITRPESLPAAVHGCSGVIHCAADYRLALAPGDAAEMITTNVGGTAALLAAARVAGVPRLVHCSTVGTLHFLRSGKERTEEDVAASAAELAGPYKRSKWAAERLALAFPGPPEVIVVQPSTPVGPGDRRPTPTGEVIRDFLAGRIPAVVDTGLNLVDVAAVGRGHVLALERGQPLRSYILGDRNWTLAQMLAEVAEIAGVAPPRWRVPLAAGYAAAVASELWAGGRRRAPAIPLTAVRMASRPMYVSSERARTELGWDPGVLGQALRLAVAELGPAGAS